MAGLGIGLITDMPGKQRLKLVGHLSALVVLMLSTTVFGVFSSLQPLPAQAAEKEWEKKYAAASKTLLDFMYVLYYAKELGQLTPYVVPDTVATWQRLSQQQRNETLTKWKKCYVANAVVVSREYVPLAEPTVNVRVAGQIQVVRTSDGKPTGKPVAIRRDVEATLVQKDNKSWKIRAIGIASTQYENW